MPINRNGPRGGRLHEVRAGDSRLLEIASKLFLEIFPEDRRYLPYLHACAAGRHPSHPKTLDHVWLVEQGNNWVGLRIFSHILTRSFGHGAYIGFTSAARGQGLGAWLVEQTLAQLDEDARQFGQAGTTGYLVEIERAIDAENEEERLANEKRMQFHRQCGAILLPVPFMEPVMIEGVDYLTPADLTGEHPRPMHLVLIPSPAGAALPNLDIVDFIHGLYLDVYRLQPDHEFVKNALSYVLRN